MGRASERISWSRNVYNGMFDGMPTQSQFEHAWHHHDDNNIIYNITLTDDDDNDDNDDNDSIVCVY